MVIEIEKGYFMKMNVLYKRNTHFQGSGPPESEQKIHPTLGTGQDCMLNQNVDENVV